jgi:23S rRNA (adenine2503-C2)-methyltransferase
MNLPLFNTEDKRVNLLDLDKASLELYFEKMGEKPFRAQQVLQWIYHQHVFDFDNMLNLSKALRTVLKTQAQITLPKVVKTDRSVDGTIKWLVQLADFNCVETVFIPESGRGTLCVSSQVGCALNCQFCATATQGFNRNLSVSEIIGQVLLASLHLPQDAITEEKTVTNVVMMGMGEPLLNYDPVVKAMDLMMDDLAFGLSKYRVTLSTSGVVPMMYRLKEDSPAALAVSLHAPDDILRTQLVPINKKYPLEELMGVCRNYFTDSKRLITMEYVMLAGVNDELKHAKALVRLLQGIPAKVNMIPFNPYPGARYQCSPTEQIEQFQTILMQAGIQTMRRKTRGDDIAAACGQLAGNFIDRTKRRERFEGALEDSNS